MSMIFGQNSHLYRKLIVERDKELGDYRIYSRPLESWSKPIERYSRDIPETIYTLQEISIENLGEHFTLGFRGLSEKKIMEIRKALGDDDSFVFPE